MTFSWNHLSTQSNQASTVLEGFLAPVWITDSYGRTLYVSPKFLELLQVPAAAELESFLNLDDFVHPGDRQLDLDLKERLLNHDIHTYTVEKRLITRTNDLIWVNFHVSRLELSEFNPVGHSCFVVMLEDITEQRKLYDALVRTEEKWKTFVLNSAHLFLQTSNVGRILYISPAVEQTLGYREEELLDRSITDLIHNHDLEEFRCSFRQWLQGRTSPHANLECRWQAKSGKWMYLYIQGQRFPMALNIEGIAISGYNISDRKHLEIELEASEKKLRSLTSECAWDLIKAMKSPF